MQYEFNCKKYNFNKWLLSKYIELSLKISDRLNIFISMINGKKKWEIKELRKISNKTFLLKNIVFK